MRTPRIFLWLILAIFAFCILAGGCGDDDDDDDDGGSSDDDDDDTPPDDDDDDQDNPFKDIPLDETLTFTTLSSPVEVIKDEYGIPHIFAENLNDLNFALGYIKARDRFFQMDILRHYASGRLAEYLGGMALDADISIRSLFMSNNGESVYNRIPELLSETEIALLQSYADGFNAYLADIQMGVNGAVLPAEYTDSLIGSWQVTADDIPEWKVEDIFALARLQQWDLSETSGMELNLAAKYAAVPADVLSDTIRFKPIEDTVIIPDFYSAEKRAATAGLVIPDHIRNMDKQRLQTALDNLARIIIDREADPHVGSNNWVVSGDLTTTGMPMLANDPHLGHMNPSVFYEVALDTKVFGGEDGFSAYGVAFPGIPAIMIGMNEYIAWGVTMAGYDVEDIYIETLDAAPATATQVYFNDQWVDIEYTPQVFKLGPKSDSATETVDIPYVPQHGPFINASVENSGGLTHKWTGHQPTNDLPAFLNLLPARDIDDFFEAVSHFQVGAQNFVGIDLSGNIGYSPHASVPIRANVDETVPPWLPLPGEGDYEWTGFIADADLPQDLNPDWGYIITANNDMVGTLQDNNPINDLDYLYWDRAVGYRAKRIDDLLNENAGTIDLDTMQTVQNDTLSLEAERFLPYLLEAADALPGTVTTLGLGDALARLEAWDFSTTAGVEGSTVVIPVTQQDKDNSVACSIFYAFWTRMPAMVFADEFAGYGVSYPGRSAIWYLLENMATSETGETLFDDIDTPEVETANDILLATLSEGLEWCQSAGGFDSIDMDDWNWGKIHKTQWEDFFGNFGLAIDIKGPYPIDGADYTVDVAGSSGSDNFMVGSGPQIRWAVQVTSDGMVGKSVIPGGESGVITSPHYNDQAVMWLNNQTHDAVFTVEDVIDHAVERIRLEP